MIDLLDPKTLDIKPASFKLGTGWHYPLDYSWVIQMIMDFTIPMDVVLDVGSLYSKFGDYLTNQGYQVETVNRDPEVFTTYYGEFLKLDLPKDYFSVITWVSSIEHQVDLDDMARCSRKSMDLLGPGGVFIATFSVGTRTYYHKPTEGWILSVRDAMRVFDDRTVRGKYLDVWNNIRDNPYKLRDAYVSRFNEWHEGSPDYIPAGVCKVKER